MIKKLILLSILFVGQAYAGTDAECTARSSMYYDVAVQMDKKKINEEALEKAINKAVVFFNNDNVFNAPFIRSFTTTQLEHLTARQFHNAIYRDCRIAGLVGAERRTIHSDPKMLRLAGPKMRFD